SSRGASGFDQVRFALQEAISREAYIYLIMGSVLLLANLFTIDDTVPIKTGKLASLDCLERSRILYQTACVKAEWNLIKTLPDLSGPGKATCVKFGSGARYIAVGSMDSNLRIFGIPSDERANNE
ncbi:unnamed protein product, partial [Brassica napus]